MKRLVFLLSFFACSFFACKEIAPIVTGSMSGDPNPPVPPSEQKRQVLIEEFTGVRCVQCPSGSAIIEDLLAAHGQQLIAISIHSGQFSDPYPQNQYDFRTPEGDNLLNYLGEPFGYPSAVVNRGLYQNQFDRQLGKDEWAGYIAEEKTKDPKVKIGIKPEFNFATRKASIDVDLFIEETIIDPNVRLSVIFTENGIIDHQLTPSSSPNTDPNYKHKHVFRGMATPFDGITISESLTIGDVVSKSFNYDIPADWKEDNVSVVVLVSLSDGDKKDVLQAHEVHLVE